MSEIDSTYKKVLMWHYTKGSVLKFFKSHSYATINSYHSWKSLFENICLNYKTVGGSDDLRGQVEFQLVVNERTSGPGSQIKPFMEKTRDCTGKMGIIVEIFNGKKLGACFSVWRDESNHQEF